MVARIVRRNDDGVHDQHHWLRLGHILGNSGRAAVRVTRLVAVVATFIVYATASAPFARTLGAQNAVVVGQVVAKANGVPLGYAVVATVQGSREVFTNAEGFFALKNLPAGRLKFTAKRIGYMPFDTTVTVGANDSLRVDVELSLVPVELPAVHTFADGCIHPGAVPASYGLQLATLFEQMRQNAERNRLLARDYPFLVEFERRITRPEPALEARFVAFDTIVRAGQRNWHYAPGKMLGTREYEDGVFSGKWTTLTLPELPDFADRPFLENHCFDYSGIEVVNGDSLFRIDFQPLPSIHTPDIAGFIMLDRKTYQLRSTLVSLVNLTKAMRKQIDGQSVQVDFKEIVPGVPIVDHLSSIIYPIEKRDGPQTEPATENQRTLRVQFLRGKPQ
ncbi:MAG TPA: carboxypeptidase-like regulatory domain-containing protein [Gemmatimonadaceae bacterium]|jgi:hypothetical protein